MSNTTPTSNDPLNDLEYGLYNLQRTAGALRAIRCLTQEQKYSEDEDRELNCMRRADLASLLDVLASDMVAQLDALEGHVHVLQGYGQTAAEMMAKARGQ